MLDAVDAGSSSSSRRIGTQYYSTGDHGEHYDVSVLWAFTFQPLAAADNSIYMLIISTVEGTAAHPAVQKSCAAA
jgi:hypothetical protein